MTNPNTLTYVDGECNPPPRTVVYFLKYNFKHTFNLIDFLLKKKNLKKKTTMKNDHWSNG
jgi:hypothetical protein